MEVRRRKQRASQRAAEGWRGGSGAERRGVEGGEEKAPKEKGRTERKGQDGRERGLRHGKR